MRNTMTGKTYSRRVFYAAIIATITMVSQATQAGTQMMYWVHDGSAYRANLDGTDKQIIYDKNVHGTQAGFIDDDPVTQKIFIYAYDAGPIHSIKSMNYDGTGATTIIDSGFGNFLYGFDVDPVNRKLYVGSHGAGPPTGMRWANLDGTNFEVIPPDPYYSHDIEADPVHGKLYWTDVGIYKGIRRSNLDGTGQENVWSGSDRQSYHLALDTVNSLIYFAASRDQIIGRMNMDGTNVTTLLTGIAAEDIELDAENGMLYWGSHTKIQRSYLDGSGLEDLVTLEVTGHGAGDCLVLVNVPNVVPLPAAVWGGIMLLGCLGGSRAIRQMFDSR